MKRLSLMLIVGGLITMTLPMFISSASAVQTTYIGQGAGRWVTGNDGVASQAVLQNTTVGPTWCVDYYVAVFPGDVLDEVSFEDGVGGQLTLENLRTIYRIIKNSWPNENPSFPIDGSDDFKAAAIQSAIWHFSNPGWELKNDISVNPSTVIENYNKILGWVDGNASNGEYPIYPVDPQASLSVDPANASGDAGDNVGPYTVNLVGGSVTVTVTGGTLVDSEGKAIDPETEFNNGDKFYITREDAGTATASISGDVVAPPGSVYFAPKKQRLVGISEGTGESTAEVTATFSKVESTSSTSPGSTTTASVPTSVLGTSVTRNPDSTGVPSVKVAGASVSSGALPRTGANDSIFFMGITFVLLGATLLSLRKLSIIRP